MIPFELDAANGVPMPLKLMDSLANSRFYFLFGERRHRPLPAPGGDGQRIL
jgi:hypothetical protein